MRLSLLDEVTTHLDSMTINALVVALSEWKGAIVLITHDRHFFRSIIEDVDDKRSSAGKTYLVDEGSVRLLVGGMGKYERMVQRRMRKAGPSALA